jgi:hypothetical protein
VFELEALYISFPKKRLENFYFINIITVQQLIEKEPMLNIVSVFNGIRSLLSPTTGEQFQTEIEKTAYFLKHITNQEEAKNHLNPLDHGAWNVWKNSEGLFYLSQKFGKQVCHFEIPYEPEYRVKNLNLGKHPTFASLIEQHVHITQEKIFLTQQKKFKFLADKSCLEEIKAELAENQSVIWVDPNLHFHFSHKTCGIFFDFPFDFQKNAFTFHGSTFHSVLDLIICLPQFISRLQEIVKNRFFAKNIEFSELENPPFNQMLYGTWGLFKHEDEFVIAWNVRKDLTNNTHFPLIQSLCYEKESFRISLVDPCEFILAIYKMSKIDSLHDTLAANFYKTLIIPFVDMHYMMDCNLFSFSDNADTASRMLEACTTFPSFVFRKDLNGVGDTFILSLKSEPNKIEHHLVTIESDFNYHIDIGEPSKLTFGNIQELMGYFHLSKEHCYLNKTLSID